MIKKWITHHMVEIYRIGLLHSPGEDRMGKGIAPKDGNGDELEQPL